MKAKSVESIGLAVGKESVTITKIATYVADSPILIFVHAKKTTIFMQFLMDTVEQPALSSSETTSPFCWKGPKISKATHNKP